MSAARFDRRALARLDELGGPALVREIATLALENIGSHLQEAQRETGPAAVERMRAALHSIVSSAGNVGAVGLQALAEAALQKLHHGQSVDLAQLCRQLAEEHASLRDYLERETHGTKTEQGRGRRGQPG